MTNMARTLRPPPPDPEFPDTPPADLAAEVARSMDLSPPTRSGPRYPEAES